MWEPNSTKRFHEVTNVYKDRKKDKKEWIDTMSKSGSFHRPNTTSKTLHSSKTKPTKCHCKIKQQVWRRNWGPTACNATRYPHTFSHIHSFSFSYIYIYTHAYTYAVVNVTIVFVSAITNCHPPHTIIVYVNATTSWIKLVCCTPQYII